MTTDRERWLGSFGYPDEPKNPWPRLMTRKMAAQYMGRCPKTFDKIRHLFAVTEDGLVRYDKKLMDRYIDLRHAA